MRCLLVVIAALLPMPLFADTIQGQGRVSAVTLYPEGARVDRMVAFSAPAGVHSLIVPGLPAGTDASLLRITAPQGVTVGTVNLAQGRLPVTADYVAPAVRAARDEIERLETALREQDAAIAAIRLKAEAAMEQVAFLRGLGASRAADGAGIEDIRSLTKLVGEEALAARQTALAAEQEAQAAERARKPAMEVLYKARQGLSAVEAAGKDQAVLTLSLSTTTSGAGSLVVTTYTDAASWTPVYDVALTGTASASPALSINRGVVVTQNSGEDWAAVDLTLSTARPSDQTSPPELWPHLLQIGDDRAPKIEEVAGDMAVGHAEAEPAMAPMQAEMLGATMTYHYPAPVDIRDGVDGLQMSLDTLAFTPEVRLVAVPRQESAAYLVARFANTTAEPLLPGAAVLMSDGAVVGLADVPLIPAGDTAELGFGAVDGLMVTRRVPDRLQDDTGVFSKATTMDETAIITVENHTGTDWPMRVVDQVPYSEQADLKVTYSATPAPNSVDPEGKRGLLIWDFALPAGQSREIRLRQSVTWPEGYSIR